MSMRPLRVTCRLAGGLAGSDPPRLDALLEWAMSLRMAREPGAVSDLGRHTPLPRPGENRSEYLDRCDASSFGQGVPLWEAWERGPSPFPVPLRWDRIGPWRVYRCSEAILPDEGDSGWNAHYSRRLDLSRTALVDPAHACKVNTTGGPLKAHFLPLRVRAVPLVRWLCLGDRQGIRRLLKKVHALGKKAAHGYGAVAGWDVEEAGGEDLSWLAPSPEGPVLMRTLPAGPWLPAGLLGAARGYGACAPPYWHPDRYGEIVEPF